MPGMRWVYWLLGIAGVLQYALMAYVKPEGYVSLDTAYLGMWLAVIGAVVACCASCWGGCYGGGGGCGCCDDGCRCGDCPDCMGEGHEHGEHEHGHEGHSH